MSFFFAAEDVAFPKIDKKATEKIFTKILFDFSNKLGQINIIFCSEGKILQVNRRFLNHDYLTDIITFQSNENQTINGELYISVETVKSNAKKLNTSFEKEMKRVLVHGVLHLVGLKDKSPTETALMRKKEDLYLTLFPD